MHSWRPLPPPRTAGPRAGQGAQLEQAEEAPGPGGLSVPRARRPRRGHGRAPRGPRSPLPAVARAVLRLGCADCRRPEAGRGVPEPLPVLPHHCALHASAAGERARRGAADLHSVSALDRGARELEVGEAETQGAQGDQRPQNPWVTGVQGEVGGTKEHRISEAVAGQSGLGCAYLGCWESRGAWSLRRGLACRGRRGA